MPPPPLSTVLSKRVTDTFVDWEVNSGGKSGVRQRLVAMFNLSAPNIDLLTQMLTRTQDFQAAINTAKTAGKVQPWVTPLAAALAFEGVFQSCAAFWLAAADSTSPGTLQPSVIAFAKQQTKAFCDCIKK